MGLALDDIAIDTSPLQRLYRHDGRYAHLLPMLASSYRSFDPGDADVVVVSHHAFANRVANHVRDRPILSYVHSPARWMWDQHFRTAEVSSPIGARALGTFAAAHRSSDRRAARRVTRLVANSTEVAGRIRRWWGLDAEVVPPPIDTEFFCPSESSETDDFFLYAGRLVGYKRPDVAIQAAQRAGVRLVVAGEGREMDRCRTVAGAETTFVGAVDDDDLRDLLRRCRALVFPGFEDFGMVPAEAQACGTPVIGLGQGGICDTVIDGTTGVWVGSDLDVADGQELTRAFAAALVDFDEGAFDGHKIRAHALQFAEEAFTDRMRAAVVDLA
jgi:glycosyltransferase involved in cell wall biosynthesis